MSRFSLKLNNESIVNYGKRGRHHGYFMLLYRGRGQSGPPHTVFKELKMSLHYISPHVPDSTFNRLMAKYVDWAEARYYPPKDTSKMGQISYHVDVSEEEFAELMKSCWATKCIDINGNMSVLTVNDQLDLAFNGVHFAGNRAIHFYRGGLR